MINLPKGLFDFQEEYSKKACDKFGGSPVIYKVKPIAGECLSGCEYICEKAIVVSKV